MTVNDYPQLLRKHWRIIVASLLIAVAVAEGIVLLTPKKYEATTQLFVSATDTGDVAAGLQQGAQFSESRVQSYANIINSPKITTPVATRLNVGLSAKQISHEISAEAPLNTVLLNVHVTDTSPQRAQAIANEVSNEFATFAANLEANADSSTPPVKVTVVKDASLPTSPVTPKRTLDLGFGILIGLVVGVAGAVLRHALDNTVKTSEDIQAATGRSAIGIISYDPGAKDHPLVVIDDLHGTRAEAFRQLRTNLQFVDVDSPLRSIVCTSSVPGEGKTTTICNLAITLAQTGMRVLLMEADLRRPRVGLYLGLDNSVGLTTVLIGAAEFDDAVQHWGPDSLLDVLPSGPTPPNPSELLGSRGMADLLDSLEKRYDIVLLDAPPLLPVTDAAVLAVETSGAVLVVHHGQTRREQLENSAQALSAVGARILGTVINFAPRKGPEAYYYGYAYSYREAAKNGSGSRRPSSSKQSVSVVTAGRAGVSSPAEVAESKPAADAPMTPMAPVTSAAPTPAAAPTPPSPPVYEPPPAGYEPPPVRPAYAEPRQDSGAATNGPAANGGVTENTPLWPEETGPAAAPSTPYSPGTANPPYRPS